MICQFGIKQNLEESGLPSSVFPDKCNLVLRLDPQLCIIKKDGRTKLLVQSFDRNEIICSFLVAIVEQMLGNC